MACPCCAADAGGKIYEAALVRPMKPAATPPPAPGLAPGGKAAKKPLQQQLRGCGVTSAAAVHHPPAAPTRKQQAAEERDAAAAALHSRYSSFYPDPGGCGGGSAGERGRYSVPRQAPQGNPRRSGSKLKFPPHQRPVHLQMCATFETDGQCYTYQCPRCHTQGELQEREAAWCAQQEAKKRCVFVCVGGACWRWHAAARTCVQADEQPLLAPFHFVARCTV